MRVLARRAARGPVHATDAAQLEAVAVHKHYGRDGVRALDGASLRVERGEWVAIVGPSGSGKSTLLQLFAALDVPTAGRVLFAGSDLQSLSDPDRYRRETIGLIFQLHYLLTRLDAAQNVEIAMFGTHRSLAERRARAHELLGELDLLGAARRKPPELSGGERQRVAIARALANEPAVLLADEPTGSLDQASAAKVVAFFDRVRRTRSMTVVMVTHDAQIARRADRVLTMDSGRIVES